MSKTQSLTLLNSKNTIKWSKINHRQTNIYLNHSNWNTQTNNYHKIIHKTYFPPEWTTSTGQNFYCTPCNICTLHPKNSKDSWFYQRTHSAKSAFPQFCYRHMLKISLPHSHISAHSPRFTCMNSYPWYSCNCNGLFYSRIWRSACQGNLKTSTARSGTVASKLTQSFIGRNPLEDQATPSLIISLFSVCCWISRSSVYVCWF